MSEMRALHFLDKDSDHLVESSDMNSDEDTEKQGNQDQRIEGAVKPHPLGEEGERWLNKVMKGMVRMTLDEKFRMEIEKDLS